MSMQREARRTDRKTVLDSSLDHHFYMEWKRKHEKKQWNLILHLLDAVKGEESEMAEEQRVNKQESWRQVRVSQGVWTKQMCVGEEVRNG